jgi:hypothetical protein
MMAEYKAMLTVEVVRYVEADGCEEAMEKVDHDDMNYELCYFHKGGEFSLEKVSE